MRQAAVALALWLVAMAPPAMAEPLLHVVTETAAPEGAPTAEVRRLAASERVTGLMVYASEVRTRTEDAPLSPEQGFRLSGGVSTWVVLALILGALLLLLRFGGSGTLMQRRVETTKTATATPEAWNISDVERATDAGDLLRQIAAMPDRRAALVRLLRHCLLRAADDCGTRFLRADTERTAFRRLPADWTRHDALGHILRESELANYGGRPVEEGRFAALLDLGRAILTGRGARLA